jgi:diphthamide biosynthesis enzyme Dph1/Dph2-like protein
MEKFELAACRTWIEENHFRTVALQLPDEDLDQVQNVIDQLTSMFADDAIELFLVGDGCSSCCNDLHNAQYCQAQALIHFGHSCLSSMFDDQSPSIAVFYVFYQQPLP